MLVRNIPYWKVPTIHNSPGMSHPFYNCALNKMFLLWNGVSLRSVYMLPEPCFFVLHVWYYSISKVTFVSVVNNRVLFLMSQAGKTNVFGWCNVSPSPTYVSPTENSWMLHPLDTVSLGYFAPDRTIPSPNFDFLNLSDYHFRWSLWVWLTLC